MNRKLKTLDEFSINESVIGKFTTMSPDEMSLVSKSKGKDLGPDDTPTRSAIIKALETNYEYFEGDSPKDVDFRASILEAALDEPTRDRLVNIAKTFVESLAKIAEVEANEIEPLMSQIESIITS
jgi:CRISPR/Cas system endoribonuclease Cas6 (RAMP superfamily)